MSLSVNVRHTANIPLNIGIIRFSIQYKFYPLSYNARKIRTFKILNIMNVEFYF